MQAINPDEVIDTRSEIFDRKILKIIDTGESILCISIAKNKKKYNTSSFKTTSPIFDIRRINFRKKYNHFVLDTLFGISFSLQDEATQFANILAQIPQNDEIKLLDYAKLFLEPAYNSDPKILDMLGSNNQKDIEIAKNSLNYSEVIIAKIDVNYFVKYFVTIRLADNEKPAIVLHKCPVTPSYYGFITSSVRIPYPYLPNFITDLYQTIPEYKIQFSEFLKAIEQYKQRNKKIPHLPFKIKNLLK
jgi:hypothetical protein